MIEKKDEDKDISRNGPQSKTEVKEITKTDSNEKKTTSSQCTSRPKNKYAYIPLQIISDPTGTDGAWRSWSCIWLAHLMRQALQTTLLISNSISKLQQELSETKSRNVRTLKKRGKYDTRREGKYWWKTSSEDAWRLLRCDGGIFI